MLSMLKIKTLETSLNYLHVSELKAICTKLKLSDKDKKGALIFRIIRFSETGKKLITIPFPKTSCANKGKNYVDEYLRKLS